MGIQLSYSAAERYLLSSMSYYLHYFLRLRPIEVSSALFFGSAVDTALNLLLENKKNNQDVNIKIVKNLFKAQLTYMVVNGKELDLRVKGTVKFSKADLDESLIKDIQNDIPENHDPSWYSLLEKGYIIIDSYIEQVLPKIKTVHEVQYNINLKNAHGDSFIGVVDLVATLTDDKCYILDNKTSSKRYKPESVGESEQLATYFDALKDTYNLSGAGYIVIPKNLRKKKEPKCEIEIILGETKEELIEQTFIKYDQVLHGIKTGQFNCSGDCKAAPWGCCYQTYCASNGTDLTGLVFHKKE